MTYHCLGLCAAKFGEYEEAARHFATDLEITQKGHREEEGPTESAKGAQLKSFLFKWEAGGTLEAF